MIQYIPTDINTILTTSDVDDYYKSILFLLVINFCVWLLMIVKAIRGEV